MPNQTPSVTTPAGFVPEVAIAFGARGDAAVPVNAAAPLPTHETVTASGVVPLSGTASASGAIGPFQPILGRAIWLTLSGSWSGSVQLMRSIDGGATLLPLSYSDGSIKGLWTGAAQAPVAIETVAGATYHLAVTLASGTLSYRMEQ